MITKSQTFKVAFLLFVFLGALAIPGIGSVHYPASGRVTMGNAPTAIRYSLNKDITMGYCLVAHGSADVLAINIFSPSAFFNHLSEHIQKYANGNQLALQDSPRTNLSLTLSNNSFGYVSLFLVGLVSSFLLLRFIQNNLQKRKKAEERLRLKNEEILQVQRAQNVMREVVVKAAAGLLAASAETLDAAIEQLLRLAGEHMGVGRAYLFQLSEDGARMSNSHEWCAPGVAPQKDGLQDIPLGAAPWWWAQILRDQPVLVPDVDALPPEAAAEKAMFKSLDICALCGYPIRREDKTLGFIGFDQISVKRDWDATVIDLLNLLASQVGSALLRTGYERDMQRQQRFTRDVLDSVFAHIAVLDRNGVIIAVNKPWCLFAEQNAVQAGVSVPNTDVGTNYLNICRHAEDNDPSVGKVVAGIESVLSGDAPNFRYEYSCHSPDQKRWFEMTVMPLSNEGGGVVISHTTITERVLAEQTTEAAKERLRRGQMYANIGTWEWDIATGDLFWTERIAQLFGYPPGDLHTSYDSFLATVHPDDRTAVIDAVNACIESDVPYDIEHRIIWPDGTVRWLLERGAIKRDAHGKPLQMIGVGQDITERVEARYRLRETEQRFAFAVEGAGDGIWDWDMTTRSMILTGHYETMLGFEKGELEGSIDAWKRSIHPDDLESFQTALADYLEGRTLNYRAELRLLCKDGSYKWILCRGKIIERDTLGKAIRMIGIHSDISERKQIEAETIAARTEAERANRAKSDFLSNMSHELRTPMNIILGFGQLLTLSENLPEEHHESVKEIMRAGHHLIELINDLLDLVKIESGTIDLSLEPVELGSIIQECQSLMCPLADKRNIRFHYEGRQDVSVRADRTRLKQVLLNLLSNAIKYNREGGSVTLDVRPEGIDRLCVRVTDTGWGIPESRLEELFQPFNRLDAENSEVEGTGIGLLITRRIVEMMGGTVGVESQVGVGSIFWIELLLEIQEEPREEHKMLADRGADTGFDPAKDHTILYIEDNPANLKLIARTLGFLPNIHLLTAHTPELGIELALAHRPELILLDINMPGMDGYKVLEKFKTEISMRNTSVIAVTANALPRDIVRGKAAGFIDYLTKPLDVERFMDTVKRCLTGDTT